MFNASFKCVNVFCSIWHACQRLPQTINFRLMSVCKSTAKVKHVGGRYIQRANNVLKVKKFVLVMI